MNNEIKLSVPVSCMNNVEAGEDGLFAVRVDSQSVVLNGSQLERMLNHVVQANIWLSQDPDDPLTLVFQMEMDPETGPEPQGLTE
jgi:hypothetical protein